MGGPQKYQSKRVALACQTGSKYSIKQNVSLSHTQCSHALPLTMHNPISSPPPPVLPEKMASTELNSNEAETGDWFINSLLFKLDLE